MLWTSSKGMRKSTTSPRFVEESMCCGCASGNTGLSAIAAVSLLYESVLREASQCLRYNGTRLRQRPVFCGVTKVCEGFSNPSRRSYQNIMAFVCIYCVNLLTMEDTVQLVIDVLTSQQSCRKCVFSMLRKHSCKNRMVNFSAAAGSKTSVEAAEGVQ